MRPSIRMLSLAALLVVGPLAPAVDGKPKSAVERSAETHFRRAAEARKAGRYIEAVAEYSAAYGLVPAPELLFNIAQAHRLAGSSEEAIAYYRKYLAKSPDGAGAAEAKQWLAYLAPTAPPATAAPVAAKALAGEPKKAEPVRPRETPRASPAAAPPTVHSPVAIAQRAPVAAQPSPLPPGPQAPAAATQPTPPAKSRAWVWGVGGGAAAVVVGAVVLGVVAGLPRDPSPSLGRVAIEGL